MHGIVLTAKLLFMRTTLAFIISSLLVVYLFGQQTNVRSDSTIVIPITKDSLQAQKDWSIRRPLSNEERQRRADNRAEVEDMKARFRQFHQEEEEVRSQEAAEVEDGNYLWSEAQRGGQQQQKNGAITPKPETPATQDLRMEISRNLQQGQQSPTPEHPVLPNYPEETMPTSYENTAAREKEENWQSTIRTSLQRSAPATNTEWQARSVAAGSVVDPLSGIPLQAGQTIILNNVSFDKMSSELNPATRDVLYQWAKVLVQNPRLIVQVRSHTHSNIPTFEAQQLTNQRAEQITLFWQQQGVATAQLSYQGYGRLSPVVSSADPMAQQKNERIELVILEMP